MEIERRNKKREKKKRNKGFPYKSKRKILIDKLLLIVVLLTFMISFVGIISSVREYQVGVHNSDLAQNMRYLEAALNISLYDTGSDFINRNASEWYIMGENQQTEAFYWNIIESILFGMCFMYIISKVDFNKKI